MLETIAQRHLERYRDEMILELRCMQSAQPASKDILIVIHNELPYVEKCIESVRQNTENYQLYLWDNASDSITRQYLKSIKDAVLVEHDENIGFGEPNNRLAAMGSGEYLILLNSDTLTFAGWAEALVGWLQQHPECAEVGFLGGLLDEDGKGGRATWGSKIDYVMGFCACISRETYQQYGLFDPVYKFAYCEDADLSLRLRSAEKDLHALHLMLIHHYENRTIRSVVSKGVDVDSTFTANHAILRDRWGTYLRTQRMDLQK